MREREFSLSLGQAFYTFLFVFDIIQTTSASFKQDQTKFVQRTLVTESETDVPKIIVRYFHKLVCVQVVMTAVKFYQIISFCDISRPVVVSTAFCDH